ncbi:MAG: hypothetical protein AUG08_14975 [Acidobacteria bacterium 13_1_20CM_2_55_15]|nr:MAG: hypothetical protein AUH28_06155 [Acidobacteria bacterium 13_1_40CM_56_16]OLD19043.1 MAG: hypothetical protein AUI91_09445 [Acidobacteria bacterium 13_1_40CM_3_56_11]OLE86327.1 MAG: hypothetical protein AUG08_14975 [Acidobacteria bacterium 13_1_20CM_2_55_15]PYS18761.1 MAG: hypothetical protein DMG17_04990 [Acidobacteriota bacterium]
MPALNKLVTLIKSTSLGLLRFRVLRFHGYAADSAVFMAANCVTSVHLEELNRTMEFIQSSGSR